VTANDDGDGDSGPNNLQNFPVLTSATIGSTTIEGTLNSTPDTEFRLEFFANSTCDPSGHGEGERFLGSTTVMTDGDGDASFSVTFPETVPGEFITATATDPDNNTSEFSQCLLVPLPVGGIVEPVNPSELGTAPIATPEDTSVALWLGLAFILAIGGGVLALRRRRAH